MRYLWQHIEQILAQYDGALPLHHFLKNYFRNYPKLGGRDRKALSHAAYSWCRGGKALMENGGHSQKDLVQAAMYICGGVPKALLSNAPPLWEIFPGSYSEAIQHLRQEGYQFRPDLIFPNDAVCSAGIDKEEWIGSLLRQPRLFLRIRKNKNIVEDLIRKANVEHEWLSNDCLALPNGTKIESLLPADCYVVQDASSQATGKYLLGLPDEDWWDCCSGAGGKSLMLKDRAPKVKLLTTDVRSSILHNLKERFERYHHTVPEMLRLDVSDAAATAHALGSRRFDGIICDVPCTGSGTWARTPESCYFFKPEMIADYAKRQSAILSKACDYLKSDGRIIYITCSVFKAENEDVINEVAAPKGLRIVDSALINGLEFGADSLFVAELRKA